MANGADAGQEVQILRPNDRRLELDVAALGSILLADRVKDKPVVVVSAVGAFRKGKSFVLSFFVWYLRNLGRVDWLGDRDAPLKGFGWRGGSDRHTTGIFVWNEVFLVTTNEGQKLAVVLMDTQGTFDCETTEKVQSAIFALRTMVSSVLVYNISRNIQEDDLQQLQLFVEYGALAQQETNVQPLQKLLFLARDWPYPYETSYGAEGGQTILKKRLKITERKGEDLRQLRQRIRSCFSKISCFLQPHPGKKNGVCSPDEVKRYRALCCTPPFRGRECSTKYAGTFNFTDLLPKCGCEVIYCAPHQVASSQSFDGRFSDNDPEFLRHLQQLVESVLAPSNLLVKEVYTHAFRKGQVPAPNSAFKATINASSLAAKDRARDWYTSEMMKVCAKHYYVDRRKLQDLHQRLLEEAKELFQAIPKMGGEEYSRRYKHVLLKEIEDIFQSLSKRKVDSEPRFGSTALQALQTSFTIFVSTQAAHQPEMNVATVASWCVAAGAMSLTTCVLKAIQAYRRKHQKPEERKETLRYSTDEDTDASATDDEDEQESQALLSPEDEASDTNLTENASSQAISHDALGITEDTYQASTQQASEESANFETMVNAHDIYSVSSTEQEVDDELDDLARSDNYRNESKENKKSRTELIAALLIAGLFVLSPRLVLQELWALFSFCIEVIMWCVIDFVVWGYVRDRCGINE